MTCASRKPTPVWQRFLVLPAHDYILKCSHTFNVLDSRGAIGITERQAYFGRIQDVSRRVAETYIAQRQALEYPWLDETTGEGTQAYKPLTTSASLPISPTDMLLEIGTEELPASDLDFAIEQLQARLPTFFDDLRLTHGDIRVMGTPRRLVVYVQELAAHQTDLEQLIKGPPADRAFDSFGEPTKAGEGFARSKGVSIHDLQVVEMDGGRYVTVVVHQAGRQASECWVKDSPG